MILRGLARPDLLREESLPDILRATAERKPTHPALLWGERVVSYSELDATSDLLAHQLKRQGASAGRIIGLLLPRGADLLIAQAGITKSGAAWLPFDANVPPSRAEVCLHSADALGLITTRALMPSFQDLARPVWAVEDLLEQGASLGPGQEPLGARPSDPAYVIYTSGSTGPPKGIAVSHRSICHFLRSENHALGIREDDRVYQGFSVAFDMSFEEVWISNLVGATLWIAPENAVADPQLLARAVNEQAITVIHAVPTLMGLVDDPLPTVRLINLGGEACPEPLVGRLARPGRQLFNTYGPTETTVSATLAALEPGRPVTIGAALPNYGVMILDESRRPLPTGEIGELAIFGPGVALGYLGRPELTAERFVENPFASTPDESRLYLTGDLGRIDENGQIAYLGRGDGQVKVRGFRVELGEIEAVLVEQPGVAAAAVALRHSVVGDELVAFVVFGVDSGDHPTPSALRKTLASKLPSYMVPGRIESLDRLPRLTSGKIDRKALREIPLSAPRAAGEGAPEAARDQDEAALNRALGEFFPAGDLAPDADFFDDLGGHSLLVARLVSTLRSNPDYEEISIQDVYQQRTLSAIAKTMRLRREGRRPREATSRVVIPTWRRMLCGAAQAITIPFLVALHMATWLAPFFVYHYFTGDLGDSTALAAACSVAAFLAMQVATFGVAIVGKWLVAGRLKAGRYPLWGWTHFRWWLASRLSELPPMELLSGTPFLVLYLQALGAKIGQDVQIDSLEVQVPELLTVESGASIGMMVHVANARAERGELVMGPVLVERDAAIESYTVLEENTVLGVGSCLGGLSALASGCRIPQGETWVGSPARRVVAPDVETQPRPVFSKVAKLAQLAFFGVASLMVSGLFFTMLFPSFMLIDGIDANLWNFFEVGAHPLVLFVFYFLLGIPASMVLVLATLLFVAGLRSLVGKQQAGRFAVYGLGYCRKWFLSRIYEASLGVLHGLFASVYASSWLRLMGAKVGRNAEVSTATGVVPDLLTLGENCFIADGVLLGDEMQRGGWMTLSPTFIGDSSFIGNGAYVADGTKVPEDVLVGVQTRTPENELMRSGQTWMGSPALLLPARESTAEFDPSLTFQPSQRRRLGRASIEALRIVFPLTFVTAYGYLVVHELMPIAEEERWLEMALGLAVAGCVFGLASFSLVALLKWTLIGRYRPRMSPMWTPFVWLSEAVTNVYEALAVPNFMAFLRGTPMLPWALRMLGARIGKGVYLDTTDLTEFDCVSIGDDSELNTWCGPQTHLFEDRVMKIGKVEIGARVTVGPSSTILYDASVGDDAQLGPLTLVAKGERVPARTHWAGSPAIPVIRQADPSRDFQRHSRSKSVPSPHFNQSPSRERNWIVKNYYEMER